jgi:hypothetical protein
MAKEHTDTAEPEAVDEEEDAYNEMTTGLYVLYAAARRFTVAFEADQDTEDVIHNGMKLFWCADIFHDRVHIWRDAIGIED